MKQHIYFLFLVSFCLFHNTSYSQEKEGVKTIKVKKESLFVKAAFDDAEFKVIAFDRYGNPHLQAIKSFIITYREGKNEYQALVDGNTFPKKTIDYLTKKRTTATKICLVKIKAIDKDGHEEDLPDLCDIVIFPDCKKVTKHQ